MSRFYGKYRGKAADNADPRQLGRVQVSCPAVLGDSIRVWAMPCVPYAGPGVGLFALPPVGADVWVEFEGGDPDYPIWAGCFWSTGQLPVTPAPAQTKVFRTDGVTVTVDDRSGSGGLTVLVSPPLVPAELRLALTAAGIELTNGKSSVKLTQASVSVNDGALEVV
ncbi:phage baseplate assembly protein V [Streptomyces hyaluromycini]|uniref:phage baseplate assembly protein V n=1 Tax=Streptomyces hyaluromycini TaxID=1377993 RepID=UPI000B5CF2E8|nr:phage baseplate assembly protein V [Streptomyces hyaluromycini]